MILGSQSSLTNELKVQQRRPYSQSGIRAEEDWGWKVVRREEEGGEGSKEGGPEACGLGCMALKRTREAQAPGAGLNQRVQKEYRITARLGRCQTQGSQLLQGLDVATGEEKPTHKT